MPDHSDDRVLIATRTLAAVIVPFLVVAFVVLYGLPASTERWFAWEIRPTMTPMVLGSVYLGGALFFMRAATARRWHTIKAGFVPVALFASMLGIATIVHWDKFNHDHVAFWLWAGLYFTTPVLVAGIWLVNRRHDRHANADEVQLGRNARIGAGVVGLAAPLTGLLLFLFPGQAADVWPWMLTPLTARVMGAIFALGVAGVGIAIDGRWTSARLMVQVETFMLLLIGAAVVRARPEFDTSNPLTWSFAAGFLGVLVGSAALWRHLESGSPPVR